MMSRQLTLSLILLGLSSVPLHAADNAPASPSATSEMEPAIPSGPSKADDINDPNLEAKAAKDEAEEVEIVPPSVGEAARLTHETHRKELSIAETLKLAEAESPELKSSAMREVESEDSVNIGRAAYLPTLDGGAMDSWGFPNASTGIPLYGAATGAYKSGATVDVWSNLDLFNLQREFGLVSARRRRDTAEVSTRVVRLGIYQRVLAAYFDASRFRSQQAAYHWMNGEIDDNLRRVRRLVRSGQHTLVSLMLLEDQKTDATMRESLYQERYLIALRRLALLLGQDPNTIDAPIADELTEQSLGIFRPGKSSPIVQQAMSAANAAKSDVLKIDAQNYPRVMANGGLGMMSGIPKLGVADKSMIYNAALAVVFPIFEGMRITTQVHQAEAVSIEKSHDVDTARLLVSDRNARFDEIIDSARIQLGVLFAERDKAQRALAIAKQRYTTYLGGLVDVREGIRNLIRIETSISDSKLDLMNALSAKLLLNGATLAN